MGVFRLLPISMLAVALMFGAAKASSDPVPMAGLGGQECGAWTGTNAGTTPSRIGLLYQQWVLGFLSGVVFTDRGHWPDGVVTAVVNSWMNEFCLENPTTKIADAAIAFAKAHRS